MLNLGQVILRRREACVLDRTWFPLSVQMTAFLVIVNLRPQHQPIQIDIS